MKTLAEIAPRDTARLLGVTDVDLSSETDGWAESSLYMVGDLAEARVKEQARVAG